MVPTLTVSGYSSRWFWWLTPPPPPPSFPSGSRCSPSQLPPPPAIIDGHLLLLPSGHFYLQEMVESNSRIQLAISPCIWYLVSGSRVWVWNYFADGLRRPVLIGGYSKMMLRGRWGKSQLSLLIGQDEGNVLHPTSSHMSLALLECWYFYQNVTAISSNSFLISVFRLQ